MSQIKEGSPSTSSSYGPIKSSSPPKEGCNFKRRRRTMVDDQADLIRLLMRRSERARNFLHEGANKEQVLFATIAELRDCQLQTQLLETKLRLLQKERGIKASNSQLPSLDISATRRQEARSPTDSLSDTQSTSTGSSESGDSPSDADRSAVFRSFSYQQSQHHLMPTKSKTLPVYRNFFHSADMAQAVFGPSLRFLDLNQSFLNCLPQFLYGPVTQQQFLSTGLSLLDIEPPRFYPGLFKMYNIVLEQGAVHIDGLVKSASPFISIDVSAWATFEPDPMSPKGRRIRYLHLIKRGEKKDPSLTTIQDIRKALIGQEDPLPLAPLPSAKPSTLQWFG